MNSRIHDFCFTLLGIAGLVVYVLACGPSFSPDGTKVAFPVIDWDAEKALIVVYDIQKELLETVADFADTSNSGAGDGLGLAYSVQWMPDGRQILINGVSLIMMLPVGSEGTTRMLWLKDEMEYVPFIPPPTIGNYQFFQDEDRPILYRLNLQNGETKSFSIDFADEEIGNPFTDGNKLYCAGKDDRDDDFYFIADLNVEDGTYEVLAQINLEEYGEPSGFLLSLGGDRFAVSSLYQGAVHMALIRGKSLEKMIPVGTEGSPIYIGNMVLSPDKESIFASFTKELDGDANTQFGVIEVPLNGGSPRQMPLFTGDLDDSDDGMIYFQIALSPDGKKIAASSLSFGSDAKLKPQDRALYLIDISRPEWEVDKIPVPLPSASNQAAAGR